MALLRIENLVTCFQTEDHGLVTAVDGISLDVPAGKTVGLVGESGCGKTVTAFSVTRLLPQPSGIIRQGRILFEGSRDLATAEAGTMQRVRGREIGMIFQEPMAALNPCHRIGRQVAEVFRLHTTMSEKQAWEAAVEMLRKVGIPSAEIRAMEYPHQLSGGMRQRVGIAIALALKPKLLIADEPTTALDVTVQAQILDLIRSLQQEMGMSVLLITHDLGVIAEMCDEVVVMYAGRTVERASCQELFQNPRHAYTRGLLASIPRLEGIPRTRLPIIPGAVPALHEMPTGCRFCPRNSAEPDAATLKERPPYQEISPGHWIEACPRCAA